MKRTLSILPALLLAASLHASARPIKPTNPPHPVVMASDVRVGVSRSGSKPFVLSALHYGLRITSEVREELATMLPDITIVDGIAPEYLHFTKEATDAE